MRRALHLGLTLMLVAAAAACEKHEFEPPSRERQEAQAATRYTQALFDTIGWESAAERIELGNAVYAAECRKCHGILGRGGADYALEQGIDAPSLVRPDWPYDSIDDVRRRIFIGHEDMPTWGVAGISPREIDAVTHYLLEVLRPEVLRDTAGHQRRSRGRGAE